MVEQPFWAFVALLLCLGILALVTYDLAQVALPGSLRHCAVDARVRKRDLVVTYQTPYLKLIIRTPFPLPKEFVPQKEKKIEILLARHLNSPLVRLITLRTTDADNRDIEVSFHPKMKTFSRVKRSPPSGGSVGDP